MQTFNNMLYTLGQLARPRTLLFALAYVLLIVMGLTVGAEGANAGVSARAAPPNAAVVPSTRSSHLPSCGASVDVVPSPNPSLSGIVLYGVAVASDTDVWAVGYYQMGAGGAVQTLIERWDGSTWSVVPSPNPGSLGNYLHGVAVVSATDVWAIGEYSNNSDERQTLIERWDGSTWSVVPSPNPVVGYNYLNEVAVASANDVWAVGTYSDGINESRTLIERWNGSAWSVVPSPNMGSGGNVLNGVAVASVNDVWVVGFYNNSSNNFRQTLIERWNGSAWSVVPSPNPGATGDFFNGVAVVSATDVWAVGSYSSFNGSTNIEQTLIERWNGSAWSVVPSPSPGSDNNHLNGVAVVSSTDVWSMGSYYNGSRFETLIERWNGSAWSVVPSPSPGSVGNSLFGVAVVSSTDVWGVGYQYNGSTNQTLIERYTDTGPCPTSTATFTNTAIPTNTATVTSTATSIPTITATPSAACPIQFQDVPPSNTFYPYVRCLACRNILGGYQCGGPGEPCGTTGNPYFRYGANITRGQIAKIVSQSAGFTEAPGTQVYEDVPTGSPFYDYVQRLTNRGYIGGYPCGQVPTETCVGPANRPYFRPQNNATRGQISKIVATAAMIQDPVSGQIYTDVTADSPFYRWIQQLSARGAMSGYPCGGAGEPCDGQNRPYFRPNANVTRGQASKIVANTFFPNCQIP